MLLDTNNVPQLDSKQILWLYNAIDCCVTQDVLAETKQQLDPLSTMVYKFEMAQWAPALEMMARGVRVDQTKRRALQQDLGLKRSKVLHILDLFAHAVWDRPLNHNSPKQLQEFFYSVMGLPEQHKIDKGVRRVSTDREALEKLYPYLYARPIVNCILTLRDIDKKLSVLNMKLCPDGRFRCSYNPSGTETGRWSSSASAFRTGCFPPGAEVLTEAGWKNIEEVDYGELVCQYKEGTLSFAPASPVVYDYVGSMLKLTGEQIGLCVTPDHRVLYSDSRGEYLHTEPAKLVSELSQIQLPLAGRLDTALMSLHPIIAALIADGNFEGNGRWRISFKKKRKIDRLIALAEDAGINLREQSAKEGHRRFGLTVPHWWPSDWGSWLLKLSLNNAEAILQECAYWDGTKRGNSFIYYTAKYERATWIQTLAHITGHSATIVKQAQSKGAWSVTPMFRVNIKPRTHARVQCKHWTKYHYEGKVYCITVPSSYFLVRWNGFISVTGNSNGQNITEELRSMFIADPGMKLGYADLEQAESRGVAYITGDEDYIQACESGDLHTTVAKMIWPRLSWPHEPKGDREIADQKFYRHFSYRDISKRAGHGSNYRGKPPHMAKILKVQRALIEEFQSGYFSAFPGIAAWHDTTASELQANGYLVTPLGRRRFFLGRRYDDATLREAIAYRPQSTIVDILNTALWRVWKANIVQVLGQVHDAIVFQYKEDLEDILLPQVLSLMRVKAPITARGITRVLEIPVEVSVGWNWQKYDKLDNPYGIKKWKGPGSDDRTRPTGFALLDQLVR